MKRAMKWGSNLITVILGLILLITMYAAVSSRINGGNESVFGLRWYEVLSGSMEPHIHTGSIIFDKPSVNVDSLKVGDVITFRASASEFPGYRTTNGAMLITHRIHQVVKQNGQVEFQTKGDANDAPDPSLVPATNVVATYDNITIPYLGYYLNFVKTRLGIGLLLILPGALIIIGTMTSLFREITRLQKSQKAEASSELSTDASKA